MFRKILTVLCMVSAIISAKAQKSQPLFTIEGKNVYASEFARECSDIISNGDTTGLYSLMANYADYRLMVADAHHRMVDTMTAYKRAMEYYSNHMLVEHVAANKNTIQAAKKLAQYSKYQYRVSIIRIDVYANSAGDSAAARSKAHFIKDRINSGKKFETVARQLSDDPNAKINGGYLGWVSPIDFGAGMEVADYIINNYNGDGSIAGPIKSGNSYYLIKAQGRREAISSVDFSPIIIRKRNSWRYNDSVQNLIKTIHGDLKAGKDFGKMQQQYSDIKFQESLAVKDAYRKYSTKILDEIQPGKISNVIETPEFFCIVKIDGHTPLEINAEYSSMLQNRIESTDIFRKNFDSFMDSVRAASGFKMLSTFKPLYKLMPDSAIFDAKWEPGNLDYLQHDELFSLGSKTYSLADFGNYIYQNQVPTGYTKIPDYITKLFHKYVESLTYDIAKEYLRKKNPDFVQALEYHKNREAYNCLVGILDFFSAHPDTAKACSFYREKFKTNKTSHVLSIRFYDYMDESNRKKAVKISEQLASNDKFPIPGEIIRPTACDTFHLGQNALADKIIEGFNKGTYTEKNNRVIMLDDQHQFAIAKVVEYPRELSNSEIYQKAAETYRYSKLDEYKKQLKSKYNLTILPEAQQIIRELAESSKK
ncbi:MAG: peptidylprolyl isomerase [Bacteroidales bacterium]|nr:peptidylprolyl isomerase [Bacteroidales bacterium]